MFLDQFGIIGDGNLLVVFLRLCLDHLRHHRWPILGHICSCATVLDFQLRGINLPLNIRGVDSIGKELTIPYVGVKERLQEHRDCVLHPRQVDHKLTSAALDVVGAELLGTPLKHVDRQLFDLKFVNVANSYPFLYLTWEEHVIYDIERYEIIQ